MDIEKLKRILNDLKFSDASLNNWKIKWNKEYLTFLNEKNLKIEKSILNSLDFISFLGLLSSFPRNEKREFDIEKTNLDEQKYIDLVNLLLELSIMIFDVIKEESLSLEEGNNLNNFVENVNLLIKKINSKINQKNLKIFIDKYQYFKRNKGIFYNTDNWNKHNIYNFNSRNQVINQVKAWALINKISFHEGIQFIKFLPILNSNIFLKVQKHPFLYIFKKDNINKNHLDNKKIFDLYLKIFKKMGFWEEFLYQNNLDINLEKNELKREEIQALYSSLKLEISLVMPYISFKLNDNFLILLKNLESNLIEINDKYFKQSEEEKGKKINSILINKNGKIDSNILSIITKSIDEVANKILDNFNINYWTSRNGKYHSKSLLDKIEILLVKKLISEKFAFIMIYFLVDNGDGRNLRNVVAHPELLNHQILGWIDVYWLLIIYSDLWTILKLYKNNNLKSIEDCNNFMDKEYQRNYYNISKKVEEEYNDGEYDSIIEEFIKMKL